MESYSTKLGTAHLGDAIDLFKAIDSESIDLVLTSPPYALHFKKEYGNASQSDYVEWFLPFAREIKRVLKPEGSFVLNIGGAWTPKMPSRSLYIFKLLIELNEKLGYHLLQEFFWYNPAKMPAPAEWVNVRKIRVKDSVEYIFWLSQNPFAKATNRNVLEEYSKDMKRLINKGVKSTKRPSGHLIKESFSQDNGGSIPSNLIIAGNNESNSAYIRYCYQHDKKIHPARFPSALPEFFIKFITSEGDVVLDPFAGSNTTGMVAERLNRKWISFELSEEYYEDSKIRFMTPDSPEKEEEQEKQMEFFS